MLNYEYRRTMQKNELLLWCEKETNNQGYYEMMLRHNRIPGVLPFTQEVAEGKNRCCYDITVKESLAERYEYEKITKEQLQKLLRDIIWAIRTGRSYLIDEDDYVILPGCMFFSKDSDQLFLCCYPLLQKKIREQLAELLEYLMGKIDYSDSAAVVMVYELYMRCKSVNCSFDELLEVLEKDEGEPVKAVRDEEKSEEISVEDAKYCLLAEKKEESIYLTRFPFDVDQTEEDGLGKVHARISSWGESVYIEDMKSSKGTFVNGRRIAGNEIQKLNHGDSVMLADRCYRFMRAG